MITINYLGWVGGEYNNAELVSYLESIGMRSTSECFESFQVSEAVALEVVQFCFRNGFWFVSEGKELTVAEEKGFYVEW